MSIVKCYESHYVGILDNPQLPSTLDPRPSTLDPRPSTLDPRPSTKRQTPCAQIEKTSLISRNWTDSSISLNERQIKESPAGWQILLSSFRLI